MNASVIYHFTTLEEWEKAQDKGTYEPPSYQREGFIHCATEEQIDGVLEKHFKEHENLIKLVIDTSRLTSSLRYDKNGEHHEAFPHIYGPLNLQAVTEIVFLDPISSEK